ncbi:MAG: amidase [Proteobacteria bacterium]|nr:amidase [Pseudomonadota bacterium]
MWTVATLGTELAAGKVTSRALVEQALGRIADPAGEGTRAFLKTYAETALAEADHSDRLRRAGIVRSPVEGIPISLKDLYDVAGDVTRAGSKVRDDAPPAVADAPAVARLRAAGAVIVGRTNMVEFAFGGVGLNPHYGTPRNPYDRKTGRVPGGSSSGAAVAVADGMCAMGLGSDTRGSVRLPAALCGVTGFKPTASRIPREGAFPLSWTLDSVGPLANTVDCCATYDAILAGSAPDPLPALAVKGLRLMVPKCNLLDELDPQVAKAFERALSTLSKAGALVAEVDAPAFTQSLELYKNGGFAGAEAYLIHRKLLETRAAGYDPRVSKRVVLAKDFSAADYIQLGFDRAAFIRAAEALGAPYDAMLYPTVAAVAPTIEEAGRADDDYFRWNMRLLRNTGLGNILDGCGATLPCQAPGEAPVGLSVAGFSGTDRRVLAVARAIEGALGPHTGRAAR